MADGFPFGRTAAIAQCFGNMDTPHPTCAIQVRNCASNLQHAVIGAGRQGKLGCGISKEGVGGFIRGSNIGQVACRRVGIDRAAAILCPQPLEPVCLNVARLLNPCCSFTCPFGWGGQGKVNGSNRGGVEKEIHPVEEWP